MSNQLWEESQQFESAFWGNCCNTYVEEQKQHTYAQYMGLKLQQAGPCGLGYDMGGKAVIDLGAGPTSMLLKCINVKGTVVDPCTFPDWVYRRYSYAGLQSLIMPAEEVSRSSREFDEAWIYNVLQHTKEPWTIIEQCKKHSKSLRIFEWIDFPAYEGHPHALTKEGLESWIGQQGGTVVLNGENGCWGRALYGHFHF